MIGYQENRKVNPEFKKIVDELEPKFQSMMKMQPAKYEDLPRDMPKSGIYLLSEGFSHLYVGRSNRIRKRLGKHCQPSSPPHAAAFAFQLARQKTGNLVATYRQQGSRADLMNDPKFCSAFSAAKMRIRNMDMRFVEEANPTTQCILEVYAAVVLGTPYNSFDTH